MLAADALAALRCFPLCCSRWTGPDDDLDHIVATEESSEDEDKEDSDDDDFDDEINVELPPDAPENEWIVAKREHSAVSPSMDKLMSLTGLKDVKNRAMSVFKEALLAPLRPKGVQSKTTMNFLFVGNPGF